jgi:hypothetical protein
MGQAASIAVVLSLSLAVVGCKGESGTKQKSGDKPVVAGPRIPAGPVPVTLPKIPAKQARQVPAATAFVTVDKAGALALGPLAPGPTPYAGKPRDPARASLEDQLFGPAQAVAVVDDPPPPEPEPDDPPPRQQGQYKMKKNNDDPQLARQQAIEAARNAGILGTVQQGGAFASLTGTGDLGGGFDDTDIYGGLLGNEIGELGSGLLAHGTFEEIGTLDALILADDAATATSVVGVIAELGTKRTSIAVEGTGAPDAVKYRFATPPEKAPKIAVSIAFGPAAVAVTPIVGDGDGAGAGAGDRKETALPYIGTSVDRDALVAALRANPAMRIVGAASITIDENTTVQQLVDVLGAAGAAGATEVMIFGPSGMMAGGFGFGRSGYGPGGGGTGWGTIGTGRYGTIGGGGSSGYGVGGGRRGAPKVSIGQPNSAGDLDKAIIRRYIMRNIQKIQYCYEKELLANPGLEGTITARFFISPSGAVTTADASGVDAEVAGCVARVIKSIEFPKPKGGGGVQVNYPFTFRPAGP